MKYYLSNFRVKVFAFLAFSLSGLLIGCTSQTYLANGDITTKGNAEYVIEANRQKFTLKPGRAKLGISRSRILFGNFELYNWGGSIKVRLPSSDFDEGGVSIDSRKSGLPYDIRIDWDQYGAESHSGIVSISCLTSGVCIGQETELDCDGKLYAEGTEDFNKNVNNDNCNHNTRTTKIYRNDCPGRQRAERGFLNSTTRIRANFTNPSDRNDIIAEFDGFTEKNSKNMWTKKIGECVLIEK